MFNTLARESPTFIDVDGQTEETVILGTSSVVEVPAAETTVSFEAYNTHTSVPPTVITFEMSVQRAGANSGQFTFLVNGEPVTAHSSFETAWIYSGTTVELSFPARKTAFVFTGQATAEVTISSEHTHLTVNGVETFVNLPGLTTTIGVSEATNVIVDLPAVTTSLELSAETYAFTAVTDVQTVSGGNYYCGPFTEQTISGGASGSPCVMGTTFTVTLPASAGNLYLHADGITTAFSLSGITTIFVPEQTITIIKNGSTVTSIVPAVVSSYVTIISDITIPSSEEPPLSEVLSRK